MTSNIATVVFEQQSLLAYRPSKLYYIAFPESRFVADPNPLKRKSLFLTVSDEFITTEIDCRAYLDAGLSAIQCHKSQWREKRMLEVHGMYDRVFEGRAYLRLALCACPGAPRGGRNRCSRACSGRPARVRMNSSQAGT